MSYGGHGPCCAAGSLHAGTPAGTEVKIHGLNAYVTKPSGNANPKGIIVIIPDIFGWKLPNSRIIADQYAERVGATVYLPDFMFREGMPFSYITSIEALFETGIWAFFKKIYHAIKFLAFFIPFQSAHKEEKLMRHITKWFTALRENEAADQPVGAAGFCWGAPPIIKLCQDKTKAANGRSLVDVAFIAHPGPYKVPDDIEALAKPTSWAIAKGDMPPNVKDAKAAEPILERMSREAVEKDGSHAVVHELKWYDGIHGFAVRVNKEDKEAAKSGEEAETQAVNWFEKWFGKWSA